MKNMCRVGILFFLFLSCAFGVQAANVEDHIESVKQSISNETPQAPSGFEQKGFVGEILSGIFNSAGNITNEYVEALKDILSLNQNNVPKWDGSVFQEGTIWDRGGNIGIGNPNPTRKFDVAGDINFTGDLYQNGTLFSGGSVWTENDSNVYRTSGRVGIGTSSPAQQLHTIGTARFDGGVMVDGIPSIRSDNASHSAQPSSESSYTGYGIFDGRNKAGDRGYYLGGGNGGDRVNFILDEADKFYIGKTLDARATLVGIGILDPQATLHVNGNIISDNPTQGNHTTTKSYVDNSISAATSGLPGKFVDGTNPNNAVYTEGRVGIGTTSPAQQLHTTGTARFDGGVQVAGLKAISRTNASHTAQYTNDTRYGFFEGKNQSGERGFLLGLGNGGDRTNLFLDEADILNISGGRVGIGVDNPEAALHIDGNAIANIPTQANHLTTKSYVDDLISSGISWKAPVPNGSTLIATYGSCNSTKEGWTTYNENDNIIYLCNGSSWINIGSTAVIPDATTTSPGKIQIAGDITGTWDNIVLKNNVVETGNVVNGTIINADISNTASISGAKINPNFGSQTVRTTGNIIAANPTSNNHLTTKSYVDAQISSISSGDVFPTCSNGQILKHNGTEFVCGTDEVGSSSSSGGGANMECRVCIDVSGSGDRNSGPTNGVSGKCSNYVGKGDASMTGWIVDHGGTGNEQRIGIQCRSTGSGGGSSTPALPTCSSGQILKHNGTEFVCANESTGGGSSSSGGADTDWRESGSAVYQTTKNIGIGKSNPTEKLDIQGNAKISGSVRASSFVYNSDVSLKKNIKTTPGLNTILKLRGVDFTWKESHIEDSGFIAQEVEEVLPQLIYIDPETQLKSVDYASIVAPLVEAIKEQQAQIEELQKQIDILQK